MPNRSNSSISANALGRLSLYRRVLKDVASGGTSHLFSHELAALAGSTPAQVRRDVMTVGYSGSPARGYDAGELHETIGAFLDGPETETIALAGVGNLGRALLAYFAGRGTQLSIVAAFDSNPDLANRVVHGCRCYPIERLGEVVREQGIHLALVAVPAGEAQAVTNEFCRAGVCGLVNFAPVRVWVPDGAYVENVDVSMSLERVAYFARQHRESSAAGRSVAAADERG